MSGHSQPGTVGKLGRLTRKVKRNIARAMKARGKREKDLAQHHFRNGFNLGAEMFKARILNATAGYPYEEELNDPSILQPVEATVPDSWSVDDMSESTLGVSPVSVDPRTDYADGDAIPA